MKLIIANWKSNPETEAEAKDLAQKTDFDGVVIAPPFVFMEAVRDIITKANLGAQNVFWEKGGAYTGEISPAQLKDLGVTHVIIGHSELRKNAGETDEMINKKILAALEAGLKPILCVGESAEIRKSGIDAAKKFIANQLERDLSGLGQVLSVKGQGSLFIAYEPIWAIGTGNPDSPESAAEMSTFVKSLTTNHYSLNTTVLYGGSVNGKNADSFLSREEIDGALVGGASLRPDDFAIIVKAAK